MVTACNRMRSQLTGLLQMCVHKMLLQACKGKRAEPATVVSATPPSKYRYAKWNLYSLLIVCYMPSNNHFLMHLPGNVFVACSSHLLAAATSYIID
jgi:hypothetical protein